MIFFYFSNFKRKLRRLLNAHDSLDKEARRVGVTRQSIIKIWLAERLEERVS